MFDIEKNKHVKARPRTGLTNMLRKMEINDSILIPKEWQSKIYQIAKNVGIKVITGKEGEHYVRVERLE